MKMFKKFSTVVLVVVFALVFVFGLAGPNVAQAATSPSLGVADSFAILAGTPNITDAGAASTITGNVGLSPATGAGIGLLSAQVTGKIYAVDAAGPAGSIVAPATLTTAKNDLTAAYTALASDACGDGIAGGNGSDGAVDGINWGGGTIDLAGRNLVPGVYCAGAFTLTGVLTLSGGASDVYIFRSAADIITSPGSSVTGGGACNVWWRAVSSVTLDTTTAFKGNILALTSITMNNGATLTGRALARNGAVTLNTNTINNATCSTAGGTLYATLHVVKDVNNDNGKDKYAGDFTLYVKSSGTNVAGSPAIGVASAGRTYLLDPGTYVVSEDKDDDYNQSFSGACNSSGSITLAAGNDRTCTIHNDDEVDSRGGGSDEHKEDKEDTPKLPAAGIAPQEKNTPWNIVIPVGILILVSTSLIIVKRKRTI